MADTIQTTVLQFIEREQLLPTEGTVVVAVSGGADSLCLLHLLHTLCGPGKRYPGVKLHVAHLDHQLRGEASERDAQEVARLAQAWQLPCTLGSCDVRSLARTEQRSLEDAAREARYRFLRTIASGQPIAVAHHQDDQVETLLLHWLRGSGLSGQLGLQPRQGDILRPLLCLTRADTLAYCVQYQLRPLEDASNQDTRFLRNRIRHELLPYLEQLNPGMRSTLLRSAEITNVDYAWIAEQVERAWPEVVTSVAPQAIVVQRPALLALPLSLQRHLLRRVSALLCGGQSPLELRHFHLIEELLQRPVSGEALALDLPGRLRLTRQRDQLSFSRSEIEQLLSAEEHSEVLLPLPGRIHIPGTPWITEASWLDAERTQQVREALESGNWQQVWRILPSTRYVVYINGDMLEKALRVRTRQPGDRMQPLGMQHEKKVQDVLVDRHIPRIEREHLPLFWTDQHCVWLGGVLLDHRVRLTADIQRILCLSLKPASEDSYA